jgi:hypothetical protein
MPNQKDIQQIQEVFSFYRSLTIELFEQELGEEKNWPFLRSRLLKIFSPERGLEAKVINIINSKSGIEN